jgi:CHAT domain-containing protein
MGKNTEITACKEIKGESMMKFSWSFKLIIGSFILFLLFGCMPRMIVKETANYKLYENITLLAGNDFGTWTKTDVRIPKGAIVAVMAKGEVWDISPGQWRWQPYQCLRFKVGEDGREIHIFSGIDPKNPFNLNVISNENKDFLYFGMGTWWKIKSPRTKMGKINIKVIVWEKGRQEQIEKDILKLIQTYPVDHQFRDQVAFMAICLIQIREYEKLQNLHKMMKEHPEIDWDRVYPHVLMMVSDFERSLGRNDRARSYLEEALKSIRRYGNRYNESSALYRLGMIASNLRKFEEANQFLDQSLTLSKELKYPEYIGTSLWAIGDNLLKMNKPAEAVEKLEEALEYLHKMDRWFIQRWCYLDLGHSYMRLNKNAESKKSFESAVKIATKVGDPWPQWNGHIWLGRMAEKEGDNQNAFEHYAKAITIIETTRGKFTDPELKALFMRDKLRIYEWMIQLLYKMQRTPEAFYYLERARARVMLDMLAEKAFASKNKEENELLVKERTLRKRIEEISMEQEKIGGGFTEPEEEISEGLELGRPISELGRLQAQHRVVLEGIEKLNPELASLVTINPLKVPEIQMLLDRDTALIEYFVGVENRFIFLVTQDKVLMIPLDVDSRRLFQKVREFRARAVEEITLDRLLSKVYERSLSELYEILIQPIEKEISGKKNIVIVPHGMLHYLPFQALLSKEGRYLIESFTISYLPSASVLKYARVKNKGNRVDIFAVGNPVTGLSPLPAAEEEVSEVSSIFEKKLVLIGQKATKTAVKSQGPYYDLMLLSTHGEMIESNPLGSNLRFTPSERDDGKLTVSEIFDMEIKANLVTLSACETALVRGEGGDFPQGDDLVGLSRAFIHAGAPSVVASLWQVSDDSTVKLMKTFYQNMRNMPKAEALRRAQIDLMKSMIRLSVLRTSEGIVQSAQNPSDEIIECSHPFFWAPFILLGDWR